MESNSTVRDIDSLKGLVKQLKGDLYVAFDLETTGLKFHTDKIIGIAVAGSSFSSYIVLREFVNGELVEALSETEVLPLLHALLQKRLVMHNGAFDCKFIWKTFNIPIQNNLYADTMLLQHTLNENLFTYGLKELGVTYFGKSAGDQKEELKESIAANGGTKNEFFKASTEIMAKYACQDVRLTYKLFKLLEPQLTPALRKFFYDTEIMPLYKNVTIEMEFRGMPLDMPLVERTQVEMAVSIQELEEEIQKDIAHLLGSFNQWYISTKFPFKLTGQFMQKLAAIMAPEGWPKTKKAGYSMSKTDFAKAVKKGKLLAGSQFEAIAFRGEKVPPELIQRIQVELAKEATGAHIFNLSSKDHLRRLFFGTTTVESMLQEVPINRTETGLGQVDDEFLDKMAQKYGWAQKLRTLNKLNKIKSTYVDGVLEKQHEGIFYPSFYQHRTVSGRYGSDIQQLPRKLEPGQAEHIVLEYGNRIRNFFIAGPGHKLIGDDFESLEPKVFSHVTRDPGLIGIFERNDDFYSTIAISTEGLTEYSANKDAPNYLGKLNKQKRQTAKAYSLGVPYGMTGYKLSFELGISQEEAEALVNKYLNAFPDLKNWMKTSAELAIQDGEVSTESGRVRRFPDLRRLIAKHGIEVLDSLELYKKHKNSPMFYEQAKKDRRMVSNALNNARNVQIQGLAASIVNKAAIAFNKQTDPVWDAYICANIHDELVVRCREEYATECAALLQQCMENTTKLRLPLIAIPCIADRYGDTK